MNSHKRFFYIMLGLLAVMVVMMLASVVFGDRFLKKQSNKLVGLKLDNQIIETQQAALEQAKKDILKYSKLDTTAKQIVPVEKDQARATREIINLAEASGIKISSIGFPTSNLGQAVAKPTTPAASSPKPLAATAPVGPVVPPITQVKPVKGISNLYEMSITVTSDSESPATYTSLIDFLGRLEKNRRTAQVSQISIQPDVKNRNSLNFNLGITLYIKP